VTTKSKVNKVRVKKRAKGCSLPDRKEGNVGHERRKHENEQTESEVAKTRNRE
jgi:hypothetical protein